MTQQTTDTPSGGIGFCGLLTLLFIGLKLGGVIGWSWWWVLSPIWGPIALVLALAAIALMVIGIGAGCVAMYDARKNTARRSR